MSLKRMEVYKYELWQLISDFEIVDNGPGWNLVIEFIEDLSKKGNIKRIWILEYSIFRKTYWTKQTVEWQENESTNKLLRAIWKKGGILIQIENNILKNNIFSSYKKMYIGKISIGGEEQVFGVKVSWPEDCVMDDNDILLWIGNDADILLLIHK